MLVMLCPAHRRIRGRQSGPAQPAAMARWPSPRPAYRYCPGRHQTAGPAADDGRPGRPPVRRPLAYGYRGAAGFQNTARRGPISTMRPRYITATRWLMRSTTAISWEINRNAMLISRWQVEHQIDNLRPNGDIQGRHRLIGYHHLRIQRQRAGNADPLPLAAGKGMG